MLKVLVGIATYKRPKKLIRLLKSLENQTYQNFDVHIVFDNNDKESISSASGFNLNVSMEVMDKPSYVIGCWNVCHNIPNYDAHLMLCDDVELFPDCLDILVNEMEKRFADLDGVIGITQECPGRNDYTYKPFGQTLMGRKFIDRYKQVGYKVCCPFYTHFWQDQEMWEFMTSLRKTYHSKEAKLYHYHPSFKPEEMDKTHSIVRSNGVYEKDLLVFKRRQLQGKLWGRSFEE